MLRQFQLFCWSSGAAPWTSSTACAADQSRTKELTSLPNTDWRFAMPIAELFTSFENVSPSESPLRSARYRRNDQVAPRVPSSSPARYGEFVLAAARYSRYR